MAETHVLQIFIEVLMTKNRCILIDEPEISMHIDWQHDLVNNLRHLNPSSQYILATHSPEIMANINDEKIFQL